MIVTDTLLASRAADGRPIQVGIAGPGFMAKGLINHITNTVQGQNVAVVYARSTDKGVFALENAGVPAESIAVVETAAEVDRACREGKHAVTANHEAMTGATSVDVVVDCTGSVEFGRAWRWTPSPGASTSCS